MRTKLCAIISLALCLPILTGCLTDKPTVVTAPQVIHDQVPGALTRPCPPKRRGHLRTTADIVNRLTYTEGALDTCSAQVDGVRAWNERQK